MGQMKMNQIDNMEEAREDKMRNIQEEIEEEIGDQGLLPAILMIHTLIVMALIVVLTVLMVRVTKKEMKLHSEQDNKLGDLTIDYPKGAMVRTMNTANTVIIPVQDRMEEGEDQVDIRMDLIVIISIEKLEQ